MLCGHWHIIISVYLSLSFTMCSCLLLGVSDGISSHLLSCSSDGHFHQYGWSSSNIFIFCRMKCVVRLKTKLMKKYIYDSSFIRKSCKGSKSLVRMFALWYRLFFPFCLDIFSMNTSLEPFRSNLNQSEHCKTGILSQQYIWFALAGIKFLKIRKNTLYSRR